ncbi:MAG: transglutaminase domain-containing protein [Suipraeoptans sp.]
MKRLIKLCALLISLCLVTGCSYAGDIANDVEKEVEQAFEIPYTEVTIDETTAKEGFYFEKLSESKQLVYKELLSGIMDHDEVIITQSDDGDEVFEIFQFVLYDRPDIFWCDGKVDMTLRTVGEDKYLEFAIRYNYTKQEADEKWIIIDNEVQNALQGISNENTEYERILHVFNYIVNNVDYNLDSPDNQNIVSVFENKVSVCAGYSKAMQYLLQKLGVFCTYVTGESRGEPHGWNLVFCEGNYYYIDVTWGIRYLRVKQRKHLKIPATLHTTICAVLKQRLRKHIQLSTRN